MPMNNRYIVHLNPATQRPQICGVLFVSGLIACTEVRVVPDNEAKLIEGHDREYCGGGGAFHRYRGVLDGERCGLGETWQLCG